MSEQIAEPVRLSPSELRTLFLFEKLDDDQLSWPSQHGYCRNPAMMASNSAARAGFVSCSSADRSARSSMSSPRSGFRSLSLTKSLTCSPMMSDCRLVQIAVVVFIGIPYA